METVSVIAHMKEIRNILSYATNIGFFFGAGTSCAFGLPNIADLTKEVRQSLDDEDRDLFENLEKSIKDLNDKEYITIEDILNYVREIRDITNGREKYQFHGVNGVTATKLDRTICLAIYNIIRNKTEVADVSDLRRFIAWYESANRGFIKEIYTANYDMLLEKAMELNYTPYFDGFTGSYEPFFCSESIEAFPNERDSTGKWIRLWKIHGSINWIKKPKTDQSPERIIRVGMIQHPENELMIYPSKEKYSLSRKEPYVAYFDRLKNYLLRGQLVYIISGYSFSDDHINEVIFNGLKNNMRLYVMVLCYSDDQVDSMTDYASSYMNLCVMGPSKMISSGKKYDWVFSKESDDEETYSTYWDEDKKCFLLGDFKKLITFLIDNSGRKKQIEEVTNGK